MAATKLWIVTEIYKSDPATATGRQLRIGRRSDRIDKMRSDRKQSVSKQSVSVKY